MMDLEACNHCSVESGPRFEFLHRATPQLVEAEKEKTADPSAVISDERLANHHSHL